MSQLNSQGRNEDHLHRSILSALLVRAYSVRLLRRVSWYLAQVLEGGELTSYTARCIVRKYHGVEVGSYSYGECMKPGSFPAGITIGRYVSIAAGVKAFRRNHPTERISTHPYFYNKRLGWYEDDQLPESQRLLIGHDAWIGANAIITPRCNRIGIGSVIGAGSVVTADVPDFAIVVGVPARILRYRFPLDYQAAVLRGRWWELPIEEVMQYKHDMGKDLQQLPLNHPLLSCRQR